MPFVLRDFASLAAGMLAHLTALTDEISDYTEGAVARSFLETLALELQRMDYAVYQGVRDGIETGTYKNFAFGQLPAVPARGIVRYTRQFTDIEETVPASHTTGVPGSSRRYQTTEAATFPAGTVALDVPVRSTTAGPEGNTSANTVVEVVDSVGFPISVTNPVPFLSGLSEETPEARRERFRLYIGGLSRGTKIALEFAARSVVLTDADNNALERVASVLVREPYQDDPAGLLGRVEVYVDNGSGTPSPALLQKVDDVLRGTVNLEGVIIPGWIAAGIDLNVYGVTAVPVAVTATITVGVGFDQADTANLVIDEIAAYLVSLPVFAEARVSEIIAAAMTVDGVVDIDLVDPVENVHVAFSQSVEPGILTIHTVGA